MNRAQEHGTSTLALATKMQMSTFQGNAQKSILCLRESKDGIFPGALCIYKMAWTFRLKKTSSQMRNFISGKSVKWPSNTNLWIKMSRRETDRVEQSRNSSERKIWTTEDSRTWPSLDARAKHGPANIHRSMEIHLGRNHNKALVNTTIAETLMAKIQSGAIPLIQKSAGNTANL